MKTTLGLFLGALLAISLAGCGDGGGTGGTGGTGGGTGGSATGGSSTGGSGTGGSATGGSGTGGSSALSCADYCTEMAANCTGDNAQYSDEASCLGICGHFTEGTIADTSGATLGCHLYHGGAPAAGEPATHCPHAGPLGGGACGADCDNFCDLAVKVCGSQETPPYADKAACMDACGAYTGTATVPYNANATAGDSLACRMYHLTVASSSDANADTHCGHIGKDSPVCL